jgi:hypothetical protein
MTPNEIRKPLTFRAFNFGYFNYSSLRPISLQLDQLTWYLRICESVGSHLEKSGLEALMSMSDERNFLERRCVRHTTLIYTQSARNPLHEIDHAEISVRLLLIPSYILQKKSCDLKILWR